ncbi:hypothetical protein MWU75_00390 [Ornithinimicrobium sp. F0845]|uniref:hypothetical protein n=1 Tax=Ornithinimicrobium sp. F0845 TaxID=2926412 RepID=UPI001FF1CAAE|nr:hypothetical protein [Ornithinimicrobium sp. F0845]MCK0110603.1 hypothetical protein [Ornithinimicrobium sp. F0845]
MTTPQRRPVYRRPRLVPFLVTGALVGLVVGVLLAVTGPDAPNASPAQEVIAIGLPGALLGGLLGGIVYLLAERFSGRS